MSISIPLAKFGALCCATLLCGGVALSQQASDGSHAPTEQAFTASVVEYSGARLTSQYGLRRDPFTKKSAYHSGVDIGGLPVGTDVYSPADGEIVFAGNKPGYGNMIDLKLSASGDIVRYGQLATIAIETGDDVLASTALGGVGSSGRSTGPHLHLEYHIDGKAYDPEAVIGLSLWSGD